jgi:multidrug efflux pump subunit AcrA (membrane-fusion protein)
MKRQRPRYGLRARISVTAAAALLVGAVLVGVDLGAAQPNAPQGSQAQVIVVRAKNACFSSLIRVTGFLVARQEAIVSLDVPGLRVTEVLANEGDKVTAGQTLVRLARLRGRSLPAAA